MLDESDLRRMTPEERARLARALARVNAQDLAPTPLSQRRRRVLIGACLAGVLLLAAGCASSIRENFQKTGLSRAALDMECSKESLTLVPRTQALEDSAHAGSLVGVEGCGQRVVYELTDAGWVEKPTRSSARH